MFRSHFVLVLTILILLLLLHYASISTRHNTQIRNIDLREPLTTRDCLPGDVLLFSCNSLTSAVLRVGILGVPFSHTGFVIGTNPTTGSCLFLEVDQSRADCLHDLDQFFMRYPKTQCFVVRLTDAKRRKLVEKQRQTSTWPTDQLLCRYKTFLPNLRFDRKLPLTYLETRILRPKTPRTLWPHEENEFVCSELTLKLLQHNFGLFQSEPQMCLPNRLVELLAARPDWYESPRRVVVDTVPSSNEMRSSTLPPDADDSC